MAVAGSVALLSISVLALDAVVDLNPGRLAKRVATTQASIVDAMSQPRLTLAAWTRGRDKTVPSRCPDRPC
ncbi:hypothetical protein C2U70_21800 [Bradyrhizobium guangdongense]|nr:hypothetical protein C2U70_21800 [Bradyrhizobium guangdongense]